MLDEQTVETLIASGRRGAEPKTFIYTSGCWVYGDPGMKAVDETMPLNPLDMVAHRPGIEQRVLDAGGLNGVVIRPGCVYGKQGGLTAPWLNGASVEKNLKIVGNGSNRWTMVHVDDLAQGYLLVGESGMGGEVFNLSDQSRFTALEMAKAIALAAGYQRDINRVPLQEAPKPWVEWQMLLPLTCILTAARPCVFWAGNRCIKVWRTRLISILSPGNPIRNETDSFDLRISFPGSYRFCGFYSCREPASRKIYQTYFFESRCIQRGIVSSDGNVKVSRESGGAA